MSVSNPPHNQAYLFDVDGTLTPARQPMRAEFASYFRTFVNRFAVFLVSGSDYDKLCEQLPNDILLECRGVFGCSGAQYFERGEALFNRDHRFPNALTQACEEFVRLSAYAKRCGTHLEFRPGVLNVSSVGRSASNADRQHYYEWDNIAGERQRFADWINAQMPGYEASVGGQISIDIVPQGWNKSSVIAEIHKRVGEVDMTFFGDRICPGGNDLPLADALQTLNGNHRSFAVHGDADTFARLKSIWTSPLSRVA